MSVRSFDALLDDARLPLPDSGSFGLQFATYWRYDGSLRLLSSHLGLLRWSLVSRYLTVSLCSLVLAVSGTHHRRQPGELFTRLSLTSLTGNIHRGVDRPPRRCPELVEGFLNQPCVHMPRSQTKPVLSLSKGLAR